MQKLKPNIAAAVAFVLITGRRPRGLHSHTRYRLYDCIDLNRSGDPFAKLYHVKPEYQDQAKAAPLYRAYAYLRGRGFKLSTIIRPHSTQMLWMIDDDGREAVAMRRGAWSIEFGKGGRGVV